LAIVVIILEENEATFILYVWSC